MALCGLAAFYHKLRRSAWEHSLNSMCATAASRERHTPLLRVKTFEHFTRVLKRQYKPLLDMRFNSILAVSICKNFFCSLALSKNRLKNFPNPFLSTINFK